jgi:hypothetical protein
MLAGSTTLAERDLDYGLAQEGAKALMATFPPFFKERRDGRQHVGHRRLRDRLQLGLGRIRPPVQRDAAYELWETKAGHAAPLLHGSRRLAQARDVTRETWLQRKGVRFTWGEPDAL